MDQVNIISLEQNQQVLFDAEIREKMWKIAQRWANQHSRKSKTPFSQSEWCFAFYVVIDYATATPFQTLEEVIKHFSENGATRQELEKTDRLFSIVYQNAIEMLQQKSNTSLIGKHVANS